MGVPVAAPPTPTLPFAAACVSHLACSIPFYVRAPDGALHGSRGARFGFDWPLWRRLDRMMRMQALPAMFRAQLGWIESNEHAYR
jgi:hypothetical protein